MVQFSLEGLGQPVPLVVDALAQVVVDGAALASNPSALLTFRLHIL